ncbi:hypothetical protein Tco_1478151, partial [Tanacetum coccineum]
KIFTSSTTKVDNEPLNGLKEDIANLYECEQTLNVSVGTLNLSAGLVQNLVSSTPYVPLSKKDYNILFQPLFEEYFQPPSSVVSLMLPAATQLSANTTGTPSSTTIVQDVPSLSTSLTT